MKAVIVGAELCGGSLAPALRGRGLTGKLHGDERAAEGLPHAIRHADAIRRIAP